MLIWMHWQYMWFKMWQGNRFHWLDVSGMKKCLYLDVSVTDFFRKSEWMTLPTIYMVCKDVCRWNCGIYSSSSAKPSLRCIIGVPRLRYSCPSIWFVLKVIDWIWRCHFRSFWILCLSTCSVWQVTEDDYAICGAL